MRRAVFALYFSLPPKCKHLSDGCRSPLGRHFSKLRSGNVPSIPEQYQDCDVLIMFNVEKLGGKYATQELFYGLFDELTEHGKQILLFSACAPHEIEKLERRNLTQFEGCLVWSMNEFNCKVGA